MTRFYEENIKHPPMLVGDDLTELVAEAMKYVTREHMFYGREIEERLLKIKTATVSRFSCTINGLIILLDEHHRITSADIENLYPRELFNKYDIGR